MRNRLFFYITLAFTVLSPAVGGVHLTSRGIAKKVLPLGPHPAVQMKTPGTSRYLPDRIVVKLQTAGIARKGSREFGVLGVDAYVKKYGVVSVDQLFPFSRKPQKAGDVDLTTCYVMRFATPMDAFKVAEEVSQLPEVVYAEPLFLHQISGVDSTCTPNDTSRSVQWNLNKILADSAFCISTGDTSVVIGIVDTGVQTDHPDLAANIWHNPGEMGLDSLGRDKRFNGIDDDGDGYVDDWQGWDFGGADYNNPIGDNDPSPKNVASGHGTHVAGIAAAATNNTTGISSIGYNCRIMAIKTTSDNDTRAAGEPYIVFGFDGIVFAADHGARVINCSWGGAGASQFEQDVINYATSKGSLVVAAAGNENSPVIDFPAGYDNVIAVAATKFNDVKPSYSNYGPSIDVSAPGGDPFNVANLAVYSTDYPSTYGVGAGTSFASPLVAGLAALVASKFPAYSPLQVGEQVRVTADNIDAVNPFYVGQMGKGRINAVRALTESWPSVRLVSFTTNDSLYGNNNGSLEPNEEFTLTTTFVNYLAPTSGGATVTLTSSDTNVQILNGQYAIGAVNTMQTVNNSAAPFLVKVASHPAQGVFVNFTLLVDDGNYHDFQPFSILINPTFATHTANNVHVTLSNIGRIGYNDYPPTEGVGFVYGGTTQLFEGGTLMGYSETNLVDNVRNENDVQDADFTSSQIFGMKTPGTISNQDGSTVFSDSGAPGANRVGVQVALHSYEFTSPEDSNYVILRYDIKNVSGASFANFYVGLFLDWDIQPDYSLNQTSFDPTYNLGYAWDAGVRNSVYCGAQALDGATGYRGLINNLSIDLSRSAKWSWISGGFVTVDSVQDIHFAISSGPYTLQAGGIQTVGFALLGGTDLTSLEASTFAASNQWDYIKNGGGRPQTVELIQPLRGQSSLNDTVTLKWSAAVGAVKYRVEVSPDTTFTQLMFDDTLFTVDTSFIFPDVDSTYYWRVIAFSGTGSISRSETRDFSVGVPLHITIPILQNPVLSPYADFVVTTTVPFLSTPTMTVAVGGGAADTVPLATISAQVYKGSYRFTASGNVDVRIYAKRLTGADITGERQFAVGLLKRGVGGTISSTDQIAAISASGEALGEDTYFTVLKDYAPITRTVNIGVPYVFGPARSFNRPLAVSLRYQPGDAASGKERFLHLYRSTASGWQAIDAWVDSRNHILTSSVSSLGTFSVGYDEHFSSKLVPTSYRLYQNYPNPFNPQTRIAFDLPEGGSVRLTVFNVLGQEVIRLVDDERVPGSFEAVWGGKNTAGRDVSSGVYFYRIEVRNGSNVKYTATQKMLLVR